MRYIVCQHYGPPRQHESIMGGGMLNPVDYGERFLRMLNGASSKAGYQYFYYNDESEPEPEPEPEMGWTGPSFADQVAVAEAKAANAELRLDGSGNFAGSLRP